MGKPGLVALRMEWPCTHAATGRHTNDNIGICAPAIVEFRQVVDDLVKTTGHKIGKLHFHHGFITFQAKSERCTHDGRFTKRGIPDPPFPKFFGKTIGYFKHAPIIRYVLSHQNEIVVPLHGSAEAVRDSINEPLI